MENTEEILVAIEENPPVIEENRQIVEEIVPNSGGILENSTESEIIEDPAPVEKKKKPRSQKQIESLKKAQAIRQERLKLNKGLKQKAAKDKIDETTKLHSKLAAQEEELEKLRQGVVAQSIESDSSEEEIIVKRKKKKKPTGSTTPKSDPIPIEKKKKAHEQQADMQRVASALSGRDYMRMLGF
jgi:seryl-tRNA synthetase